MKSHLKFIKVFLILTLLYFPSLYAQNYKINYCGISSKDIDSNMAKITSDLYYTQLSEIQDFTITDKRDDFSFQDFDTSLTKDQFITFYVEIKKLQDSDKWQTVFYLYNPDDKETSSITKDYESYYKILMEPKSLLQSSIKEMVQSNIKNGTSGTASAISETKKAEGISTEILSGNWHGENFINKIVILRGGRGFVIYNNGASMNIKIEIEDKKVIVSQNQKSNASYFPDLPREIALEKALSAEPITWTFEAQDNNTLKGSKHTLLMKNGAAEYDSVEVCWKRAE